MHASLEVDVRRITPPQIVSNTFQFRGPRFKCCDGTPLTVEDLASNTTTVRPFDQKPRFVIEFPGGETIPLNSLDNCFMMMAPGGKLPAQLNLMHLQIEFTKGLIVIDQTYTIPGTRTFVCDSGRVGVYFDQGYSRYLVIDGIAVPTEAKKVFYTGSRNAWLEMSESPKVLPPNVLELASFKP